MIKIEFFRDGDVYCGFRREGHAEYADYGSDTVCASVSGALNLALNVITQLCENYGMKYSLKIADGGIGSRDEIVVLFDGNDFNTDFIGFLKTVIIAFKEQISFLAKEYPENIAVPTECAK